MNSNSFKNLNLHEGIVKAVEELGFSEATPIQQEAIPMILSGVDLRASAQTGTGKTAAFILPALHKLTTPSSVKSAGPRILILVPTRELAMQVAQEATKFSKHLSRVKTVCIYGGAPYPVQNRELSRPFEILVATPGRLIDHMERGRIDFSRLEMLILDEADRMLDMGFIEPVEQIAKATPENRQTLMFSATLKGSVLDLSNRLLNKPKEVNVAHDILKVANIEERLHYVDNLNHKHRLLEELLIGPETNQTIVFTSTKRNADLLVDLLLDIGHKAASLHGDMNQRQRSRTLENLRRGFVRVLVATDVAARGIDVLSITHVINFDLPQIAEDYVHRIGRTGRAGGTGIAMSFASDKEMHLVRNIEKFTGKKITIHTVPGLEPKPRTMGSREMRPRSAGSRNMGSRNMGSRDMRPRNMDSRDNREGNRGSDRRSGDFRFNDNRGNESRSSDNRSQGFSGRDHAPRDSGQRDSGQRDSGSRDNGQRDGGYREGGSREGGESSFQNRRRAPQKNRSNSFKSPGSRYPSAR